MNECCCLHSERLLERRVLTASATVGSLSLMSCAFVALNISGVCVCVSMTVCAMFREEGLLMHNLMVKTNKIADFVVYGSRVKGLLRKRPLWFPGLQGLQPNSYCKAALVDGCVD